MPTRPSGASRWPKMSATDPTSTPRTTTRGASKKKTTGADARTSSAGGTMTLSGCATSTIVICAKNKTGASAKKSNVVSTSNAGATRRAANATALIAAVGVAADGRVSDLIEAVCPAPLATSLDVARDYAERATAYATRRAYASDWQTFATWCAAHDAVALPASPQTVAAYLGDAAGQRRPSTLRRQMVAIALMHRSAAAPNPVAHGLVRTVWRGIQRTLGTAPQKKTALRSSQLKALVDAIDLATPGRAGLAAARDRALLLIGFAGALRRAELAAVAVADLTWEDRGLVIRLPRSKTDATAAGVDIGIAAAQTAYCPNRALETWLCRASIASGPVFRAVDRHGNLSTRQLSATVVATIVKARCAAIGLDPETFAGHSLRSGFLTSAAEGGAEERDIMAHSRHRDVKTARGYIQRGALWRNHAGDRLGL